MKKSCCFTLAFSSKSVKCRDIVFQGLYTMRNKFYMHVSNPCATRAAQYHDIYHYRDIFV